MKHVKDDIMFI